ncbi:Enolase [Gammaproteobacteria bacterium]
MTTITDVRAYEVLDSRGTPTVEAAVILDGQHLGRFCVPSGASTGRYEALELRDNDPLRYGGLGVQKAVENIRGPMRSALIGRNATDQRTIDKLLIDLDGTENKSHLGANAILAVSVAYAKAIATSRALPLPIALAQALQSGNAQTPQVPPFQTPVPTFNVLNGGVHADSGLSVQEFMIAPVGASSVTEAIRWGVETYRTLRKLLMAGGHRVSVGDEGGFAPQLDSNERALEILVQAITAAGYVPGEQIGIVLDVAATELYRDSSYHLAAAGSNQEKSSASDLIALYQSWVRTYPILGIEDGLAEDDWEGWRALSIALGDQIQLIGDDLFVTNIAKLSQGITTQVGNAIIIKPNQIGTLSETADSIFLAQSHNYVPIMANRSAENADSFIADLALALSVPQIKTGAPCRGERIEKYNQLIRIDQDFAGATTYAGARFFPGRVPK